MKPSVSHLLDLLSSNDVTFFIPPYQRNYEWDISQCEVFYNDIKRITISNLNGEKSEHFFGTIVYVKNDTAFGEPSKLVLTDGQQRITTTMLFLVAIRDVIEDEQNKKFINDKYLTNENVVDETEYKIKLKQVETDWEAYLNIIMKNNLTEMDKKSAVYQNYTYFVTQLKKVKREDQIKLIDLISRGLAKFSVVTIELEPERNKWENPQEVFESMNSLGKPLSLADLVRNYLLLGKKADDQKKLYKNYWLHIEKQLPKQVSNFLRDFMQLKAEKAFKKATATNYKELYADFKELFKNEKVESLLSDLNIYSDYYAYIVLGKTTGSLKIDRRLEDLRTIDVTIAHSFLLSLLNYWKDEKLSEQDLIDVLDALIVYFIRRRIIKLTQGENKNFPVLVKLINKIIDEPNKKQAMFNILANQENSMRLPNDSEVKDELMTMNFYNYRQAQFILSLVEEKITKSRPDKNDPTLQKEHIMPQNLNNVWKNDLGDNFENVHQSLVNNIGNITLIRHNQELGNKSFAEKREVYKNNAGLQIAQRQITNYSKWDRTSIEARRKWIVDFIVNDILIIPEEMKDANNFHQKRKKGLSFEELEIIGEEIHYLSDPSIVAKVVADKEVEFEGKRWRLSPLTNLIETRKGTVNASGAYQGAQYWAYEGMKLADHI